MENEKDPIEIQLTGVASSVHPAERAILHLKAESHRTSTPAEASAQMTRTSTLVREILTPHCPADSASAAERSAAAISHYSMSTVDTTAYNVTRNIGGTATKEETVYTARAEFHIKFASFDVLNALATQLSAMDHVMIKNVTWDLTDDTSHLLYAEVRKKAAKDALQRARDYAEVFCDFTREEAVARLKIARVEEDSYPYERSTEPHLHFGKFQRSTMVKKELLQFEPEDVSIEAKVKAVFYIWET